MRHIEIRHLVGFIAVAEELHFGRAAERLRIAQPPLSQQIRQLEKELGVQLFDRSTRRVRLTSAGQAFVDPARRVLDDLDTAVRAALAGGKGELGRVAIGFSGAASHISLPRLARAVRATHPGLELDLRRNPRVADTLGEIADGVIDLGFVRLPVDRAGVATRVIERETLLVAVPAQHPLAGEAELSLAELRDEPFLTFPGAGNSAVRDAFVRACGTHGYSPRIAQVAPDTYTILALVAAGVGLALLPSSVQYARDDGVVFLPTAHEQHILLSALAWRTDNASSALQRVLEVAERALPTPPAPPAGEE